MLTVKLTRCTPDLIDAIDEAAANCYDTKDYKPGALMKHCIENHHLAIAEFGDFTFHIDGLSRAALAQLTRHRLTSLAVRSQRYCDEDGFEYVVPPSILKNEKALKWFIRFMTICDYVYAKLVSFGVPKEDARFVLPNACETRLEIKMNLRELMHFMNERLCIRAQWEIRNLAKLMRDCVLKELPELKPYLVPKCEVNAPYCFCTEKKSCGRHPKLGDVYGKAS